MWLPGGVAFTVSLTAAECPSSAMSPSRSWRMSWRMPLVVLACSWLLACAAAERVQDNQVFGDGDGDGGLFGKPRKIRSGEELLSSIVNECLGGELPTMSCLRVKVLSYLDTMVGSEGASSNVVSSRSLEDGSADAKLDKLIAARAQRYLDTHEFKVQLPEVVFQEAVLSFKPSQGIDGLQLSFPDQGEGRAFSEGTKKKSKCADLAALQRTGCPDSEPHR